MTARLPTVAGLLAVLLAGSAEAADAPVRISIVNAGTAPFSCAIQYAHSVTEDLGELAPGARRVVEMVRQTPAGALYVPRYDGRPLMIETILCGSSEVIATHRDTIPLDPIRVGTEASYELRCRSAERFTCDP